MIDSIIGRLGSTRRCPETAASGRKFCGMNVPGASPLFFFLAAVGGAAGCALAEPLPSMQSRGVVQAVEEADLSTDLAAPVTALPFRTGERFREGDVLVLFDCARRLAELAAAKARQKEASLVLESNSYLERRQALAQHEVEISRARVEQATAEVAALEADVSRCSFRAPFAGRVADVAIHRYETPSPSKPFMRIVGENEFEIKLIVPSVWLRWLRNGLSFDFVIDETERTLQAYIVRLGGEIDPVSQTLAVFGRFSKATDDVVPGMSGRAVFAAVRG